jgi:hypothetical protein
VCTCSILLPIEAECEHQRRAYAGLLDVAIDGIRGHAEAQRAVAAADSAAQAANVHVGDYGEVDHWIWAAGPLICVD